MTNVEWWRSGTKSHEKYVNGRHESWELQAENEFLNQWRKIFSIQDAIYSQHTHTRGWLKIVVIVNKNAQLFKKLLKHISLAIPVRQ